MPYLDSRSYFVDVLSNIITSTYFTRYELEESVLPLVEAESQVARADSATHALELAHALAFRSGLGKSLFAVPHSHITIDDVREYAAGVFGKGGVAVIGTGISQETLTRLLQKSLADAPQVSPQTAETTKYFGGETRVDFAEGADHTPHAVFFGFGSAGQPKPELAVLAAHLSPVPSVKWSTGLSPLATTLPKNSSAQSVYLPYSDATLFGLLVQGKTPEAATEAAQAAVKAFQAAISGNGLKEEEVKRAVVKAKFLAASAAEGREGIVSTFGPSVRISILSLILVFSDILPALGRLSALFGFHLKRLRQCQGRHL